MDFKEVVDFALKFLEKNRVVGNSVIRDLRSKSTVMPSNEWMEYFKGSIAPKTYTEIHNKYMEHRKPDYGFAPIAAADEEKIDRYVDDVFAVSTSDV